jgi:Beta-galactosidase, domain 3/Beta-galactosidase, domain 2
VPVRLTGTDAKLMATDIALGGRRLRYTTAQPMVQGSIGRQDVGVFVSRSGDPVDLAPPCDRQPTVAVLDGAADSVYDPDAGLLRINAALSGLTRVLIRDDGHGDIPLLLLLADDDASAALWPRETGAGAVLVRGPALVRSARVAGSTLHLTGDTAAAGDLEVWAPRGVDKVFWNEEKVAVSATASGGLTARDRLPGPDALTLPQLTGSRRRVENPERHGWHLPGLEDSDWQPATLPHTETRQGVAWHRTGFRPAVPEMGGRLARAATARLPVG